MANAATEEADKSLGQFADFISHEVPTKRWKCGICAKYFKQKFYVYSHLETFHFPTLFNYSCEFCGNVFNNRNKWYKHLLSAHKDMKKNNLKGLQAWL